MAGYVCGGCDGAEPATILITPLNGAETLAVGEECMPVTLTGMLAGTLGVDAEALWDAATQLTEVEAEEAAQQAAQAGESGQEDSVFVRVPHGTPDEEPEEETP